MPDQPHEQAKSFRLDPHACKHPRLAEQTVQAKRDALVAVETSLGDLDREVRRQETEIEQVRAREDRDRKLLADGNVNSKQLTDLEHELATLQRRQGVLEDDLLELMERREAVDGDTNHARVELDKAQAALSDAQGRRDSALADLDSTEAKRVSERELMIKLFPADLLGLSPDGRHALPPLYCPPRAISSVG